MKSRQSNDKVFVAMGSFHMKLAMFGAIGKYIAEFGTKHVLSEPHVIEKVSLNGFRISHREELQTM
jgi:hypothetical protein